MRKEQIEIGKRYVVKWYDRIIIVRIESESLYGGWNVTDIRKCRRIRIWKAAQILHEVGAEHGNDKN